MARRRAAGALDGGVRTPRSPKGMRPLPWAKLGERPPRRKVYPGAIRVTSDRP